MSSVNNPSVTVNLIPFSDAIAKDTHKVLVIDQKKKFSPATEGGIRSTVVDDVTKLINPYSSFATVLNGEVKEYRRVDTTSATTYDDVASIITNAIHRGVNPSSALLLGGLNPTLDIATYQTISDGALSIDIDGTPIAVSNLAFTALPATGAILTGGTTPDAVSTFTAITDGSFSIEVDGTTETIDSLDFSSVTDETSLIAVVNAKLSGAVMSYDNALYSITSASTGATSTISFASSFATGTDVSIKLKLQGQQGGTVSNGIDEIPAIATFNEVLEAVNDELSTQLSGATITLTNNIIVVHSPSTGTLSTVSYSSTPTSGTDLGALFNLSSGSGAQIIHATDQMTPSINDTQVQLIYDNANSQFVFENIYVNSDVTVGYMQSLLYNTDISYSMGLTQPSGAVIVQQQDIEGGSKVEDTLVSLVPQGNEAIAKIFGKSSSATRTLQQFRRLNQVTELDCIALLEDENGTPAEASIMFVGTAQEDSRYTISVISESLYSIDVDVLAGDDEQAIIDKIVHRYTILSNNVELPFSYVTTTNRIEFTCLDKGTVGNTNGIKITGSTRGVEFSLEAFHNGASDPDISALWDLVDNVRYHTILFPSTWDIRSLQNEMNERFNVDYAIMDGVGLQTISRTYVDAFNYNTKNTLNSQVVVVNSVNVVDEDSYKGCVFLEPMNSLNACVGAVRALRLTNNANLSGVLVSPQVNDSFGGIPLSTLPYQNTSIADIDVPNIKLQYSPEEVFSLLSQGISTLGTTIGGTDVVLGQQTTTQTHDSAGNKVAHPSWLNLVDAGSSIRYYYYTNFKQRYAQTRLVSDDTELQQGFAQENELTIRSFCKSLYIQLGQNVITQIGDLEILDFMNTLIVEIDISLGEVKVDMTPLINGQLRAVMGNIRYGKQEL